MTTTGARGGSAASAPLQRRLVDQGGCARGVDRQKRHGTRPISGVSSAHSTQGLRQGGDWRHCRRYDSGKVDRLTAPRAGVCRPSWRFVTGLRATLNNPLKRSGSFRPRCLLARGLFVARGPPAKGTDDDDKDWNRRTQLVHEGSRRSQYGEMAEAIFLTQGFVYDSAEAAEARFIQAGRTSSSMPATATPRRGCSRSGSRPSRGRRMPLPPPAAWRR